MSMMTPVATCVGVCFSCCLFNCGCCVRNEGYFTHNDKKTHLGLYFGLYVPLTIICAKAYNAEWALIIVDGTCWGPTWNLINSKENESATGSSIGFLQVSLSALALQVW